VDSRFASSSARTWGKSITSKVDFPGGPGDLVVDIGGTKVLAALARDGEIIARARLDSGALSQEALVSRVIAAAQEMLQREELSLGAALVAVPGAIDRDAGLVVRAANLPFKNFPLKSVLSQALGGVDVVLEDDANCGAVGEASVGGPGMLSNLVYVTLSTGIGMGSVAGGRLMVGAHGYAGELGHVTVIPGGRPCGCGRQGCLEAYASGRAIGSLGAELWASDRDCLLRSSITDPNTVTAEVVIAAAEAGDEGCSHIVDNAIALLKLAIQMVQLVIDPEVVVLGGGLMGSKFFGQHLLRSFHDQVKDGTARNGPTVRAAHFGDDSVIVGGISLLSAARRATSLNEIRGV
jgi:glucokinase